MSQRPLSPSDLPDEASADERLAQVSDDLPEPRLVLPLDDEEPDAPVLEDNAPVSLNGLSQHPADLGQHAAPSIELLLTRPDPCCRGQHGGATYSYPGANRSRWFRAGCL